MSISLKKEYECKTVSVLSKRNGLLNNNDNTK